MTIGHSLLTTIASEDAAIESHESSIQRACPVMRASPAPMVAIKSAKAASAQTMRRKALSNRLLVPSCCQCGHCLSTACYNRPPSIFECPVGRLMGGIVPSKARHDDSQSPRDGWTNALTVALRK
jgi:hypothetical protein